MSMTYLVSSRALENASCVIVFSRAGIGSGKGRETYFWGEDCFPGGGEDSGGDEHHRQPMKQDSSEYRDCSG